MGVQSDLTKKSLSGPYLENTITETHFSQRNRHGRIVGLMAAAIGQGLTHFRNIRSISADEGTAFCYNSQGLGTVHGLGQVYFLKANFPPEILRINTPLTWDHSHQSMEAQIFSSGAKFHLPTWQPDSQAQDLDSALYETWSVQEGNLLRHSRKD